MLGPDGRSVEAQESPSLEDAVDDGVGEIVVVEDAAPAPRMLVGGEDHRASSDVAVVDDVIEDVRCVVAVGEVADLVDDEDMGLHVHGERVAKLAVAARDGELVDELRGRDEARVEPELHRAIRDGDREMGLAASGLAFEDDRVALGDEVRREKRTDRREPQRRLIGEVELLDRTEKGKARCSHGAREACAASVGDFFIDEGVKKLLERPFFLLGALDEVAPNATRVGEMKTLEERIEVGAHASGPFDSLRARARRTPATVSLPSATARAIATRITSSPCCSRRS